MRSATHTGGEPRGLCAVVVPPSLSPSTSPPLPSCFNPTYLLLASLYKKMLLSHCVAFRLQFSQSASRTRGLNYASTPLTHKHVTFAPPAAPFPLPHALANTNAIIIIIIRSSRDDKDRSRRRRSRSRSRSRDRRR